MFVGTIGDVIRAGFATVGVSVNEDACWICCLPLLIVSPKLVRLLPLMVTFPSNDALIHVFRAYREMLQIIQSLYYTLSPRTVCANEFFPIFAKPQIAISNIMAVLRMSANAGRSAANSKTVASNVFLDLKTRRNVHVGVSFTYPGSFMVPWIWRRKHLRSGEDRRKDLDPPLRHPSLSTSRKFSPHSAPRRSTSTSIVSNNPAVR